MEQRSKIHHYLPQFILRGFARGDQVTTVDLAGPRSYVQNIATAAAENDFNTVLLEDGTKSDIAERTIARDIEGPASDVLARIRNGGWFDNDKERLAVGRLLALQYVRVPVVREQADATADLLLKLDMAAGGPTKLREILESQGEDASDAAVRAAWEDLRDFGAWRLKLPRESHVLEMLSMADEFGPALMDLYAWNVLRLERRSLLTCDAPVVLVPHRAQPEWSGVGLFTAGSIIFNVGRRTALFLANKADAEYVDGAAIPPSVSRARTLAQGTALSARQRLYHHPDDTLEEILGADFQLPRPREVVVEDAHATELMRRLKMMAEHAFDHPDEPHPMSGQSSFPPFPNQT